jgi:ABC-type Zn2+ transport system substrate-binding protein/surface adhesin
MQVHLWVVPSNTKILGMQQQNLLSETSNSQTLDLFVSYDAKIEILRIDDENSLKLFRALHDAYNYFKEALFNNILPPVILTLNRNPKLSAIICPMLGAVNLIQLYQK